MYSLNKLESYSQISALGPVGHCTSHFKRAVCISCRQCVDVHKGEGRGPAHVDRGEGGQNVIFCRRHKWMAPKWKEFGLSPWPFNPSRFKFRPNNGSINMGVGLQGTVAQKCRTILCNFK